MRAAGDSPPRRATASQGEGVGRFYFLRPGVGRRCGGGAVPRTGAPLVLRPESGVAAPAAWDFESNRDFSPTDRLFSRNVSASLIVFSIDGTHVSLELIL